MKIEENEKTTRRERIEPKLRREGWIIEDYEKGAEKTYFNHAVKEYPTKSGPVDYALFINGEIIGVIEAKKITVGPYGKLPQAERYARGIENSKYNFNGFRVPFAYSTNGEEIWFKDLRDENSYCRKISSFHTPNALLEMLNKDIEKAKKWLLDNPNNHRMLRYYQTDATKKIEEAIIKGKRRIFVAMATGTGKTYMIVSQIYRLLKSGMARRVLFLVDRRALAAQAVNTFKSFEPEPGYKFDQLYEVYSQRFRREEIQGSKFEPTYLPEEYLANPKPNHTFVYVCTIQRMRINLFGKGSEFEGEEEDAERLDIPIHAFDVIIADECHRGYTAQEISKWREVLDYFDGIIIGLTATPAAHTVAYFGEPVYRYSYEQAVKDGYLVDYDAVAINSGVRIKGVFLRKGELVGIIDPETGIEKLDNLEDEREFDASKIEREITSPDSNRKIIEEIKKYALEHEKKYGRFPKTLIFAVNDLPHISHADQLVKICREVFERGDDFVQKITGTVDRPLQKIREFRNRPKPGIVVTVDMLTTGVDIPSLEFLVFLRPVKSRILFEQMMGRGTRKCSEIEKDHFMVFDCFGGTLLNYFKDASSFTIDPPTKPTRSIKEIIEDIYQNRDREYNIRVLVRRLLRIEKNMSGEAIELFSKFIPDGDISRFARNLPQLLRDDFANTIKLLRDPELQDLLVNYPRAKKVFYVGYETKDEVSSTIIIGEPGESYGKPEDYIKSFEQFIKENKDKIEAIKILLDRPQNWSTKALHELRKILRQHNFREDKLRKAYHKEMADIISLIKHAANEENPILTPEERVEKALDNLTKGKDFTDEQKKWLEYIKEHLIRNLAVDKMDFEEQPIFYNHGGWKVANRVFDYKLESLLQMINYEVARI